MAEDQPGHRAVDQEIVPLDRRAEGARNDGATQMRPMLGLCRCPNREGGIGHLGLPTPSTYPNQRSSELGKREYASVLQVAFFAEELKWSRQPKPALQRAVPPRLQEIFR